jgi:hypothetical protein
MIRSRSHSVVGLGLRFDTGYVANSSTLKPLERYRASAERQLSLISLIYQFDICSSFPKLLGPLLTTQRLHKT